MFNTHETIIIWFILIEVLLTTGFVLVTYAIKWRVKYKKKRKERLHQHIHWCLQKWQQNNHAPLLNIQEKEQILLVLEKSSLSTGMKQEIVKTVVLKHFQYMNLKYDWHKRLLFIKCFNYYIDSYYYPYLMQLMFDNVFVVALYACCVASNIASPKIYQAILDKLYNLDHATRIFYIYNFHKNKEIWPYLESQLRENKDTLVKKIIYDLLRHTGCDATFFSIAKKDSFTGKRNMQLAAIRVMAMADKQAAFAPLIALINDSNWLVRNTAVNSLSTLKIPEARDVLMRCLKDDNWWVRISAGKALANDGQEGRKKLQEAEFTFSDNLANIASYFLKINEIKESL